MNLRIKNIVKALSLLFYPTLCCVCRQKRVDQKPVCKKCSKKILPLPKALLQKVQEEVQANEENPVFIGFIFNSTIQELLHCLKYKNIQNAGIYAGQKLGELLVREKIFKFDYIIPVPIHKKRLQERGYNQSELIAQGLARLISTPVLNKTIYRKSYTNSQTKLNKEERMENVKNKFKINNGDLLKNKTILLLDDVITTGATINECAKTIDKFQPKLILKVAVATPLF
ncbi:MAG: ComF family protein [Calditrichia bacterium]|nr:ComF family protein [Calditrichia bacterium]